MTTFRKVIFANDQFYHVYNRGVERRDVFKDKREYARALETLNYYRFANLPIKLSRYLVLTRQQKLDVMESVSGNILVDIIAFCLMPNHFHFLIKQAKDNGISKFLSNFTNSYTKFFNTKNEREGPLFQGIFKAVMVETDEQLIHLSRYIHLNPVSSFLIKEGGLENYLWSSYPEYLNSSETSICNKQEILSFFSSIDKYKQFLHDQVAYAQELEKIKHLTFE